MQDWYGHSMKVSISTGCMSYREHYLDLDPTYKDPWGQPLLRITFDWKPNELKLQQHLRGIVGDITKELNPDSVSESYLDMDSHWDITSTSPPTTSAARSWATRRDQRAQPLSAELGRA